MTYVLFSQMVEANGKTVRENNMEIVHKIPIGTLVYLRGDEWHGSGASERWEARLYVVSHDRDCDGTPLYSLAPDNSPESAWEWVPKLFRNKVRGVRHGYSEASLTVVEVTDAVFRGEDALQWTDDEEAT